MKSHRPERVASIVRAVVSDAIASKLGDPRIAPMSSVTRVEVSSDLEHAKVWVSVMGEASVQRRTMEGLRSATGAVQRLVGGQLPIRQCPRLSFHLDESIKKAAETIRLIEETMAELADAADEPAAGEPDESSETSRGDGA